MSKQKDDKPPKGKQESEGTRERKGTFSGITSLFKGDRSAKSPANAVSSSPLDTKFQKEKGRERIGSAPQQLNAAAVVIPLTPDQEEKRQIAVNTAQELNSRQVISKVDVKQVCAMFDEIPEINNAVKDNYRIQDASKFRLAAIKDLEDEPGHGSLRSDLNRLRDMQKTSTSAVAKATARDMEKGLLEIIDEKAEQIRTVRTNRETGFNFSDIVDEAYGAHVAIDAKQGVGFARGQAENDAIQNWTQDAKNSSNPMIKLANDFVDLYAHINTCATFVADLNHSVSLLDPKVDQSMMERAFSLEDKLNRVNNKVANVKIYFDDTQSMLDQLQKKLQESIPILETKLKTLEGKNFQDDSQPGTIKIESEDRKRHSEVKTLLDMSRKLQEALTGISIGKTVDAPHLSSKPNSPPTSQVTSSTSSATNNPAPSSSPSSASSQQPRQTITLRGQEHMTPRAPPVPAPPVPAPPSNTSGPRSGMK